MRDAVNVAQIHQRCSVARLLFNCAITETKSEEFNKSSLYSIAFWTIGHMYAPFKA